MNRPMIGLARAIVWLSAGIAAVALGTAAQSAGHLPAPKPTKTPTPTHTSTPTFTFTPTETPTATQTPIQYMHFTGFSYPSCPFGWPIHDIANQRSCEDWQGGIVCNWHMANINNSWRCTRFAAWFTDIRAGNQPYSYVIDSNTTGNYINSFPSWWMGPVTIYFAALGGGALPGEGEAHRSGVFYTTNRFFEVVNASQWTSDWNVTLYLGPAPTPTATPSPTATETPTPTGTPTLTPTNTAAPTVTPRAAGACWAGGPTWFEHYPEYQIDPTSIPTEWFNSVEAASGAWSDAGAFFGLQHSPYSRNPVRQELFVGDDAGYFGLAGPVLLDFTGESILSAELRINSFYDWDTRVPPRPARFSVRNLVTHEFGHWIDLYDVYDTECSESTMYGIIEDDREWKKITLDTPDVAGLYWAYPTPP